MDSTHTPGSVELGVLTLLLGGCPANYLRSTPLPLAHPPVSGCNGWPVLKYQAVRLYTSPVVTSHRPSANQSPITSWVVHQQTVLIELR